MDKVESMVIKMLDTWTALILGLVQGLTEFLPVSSSGHLVLLQHVFGIQEAGLVFDIILHLATLMAVLLVFYREFWEILRRPASRLTLLIVAGLIPTAIIGLVFNDFFKRMFASGQSIGWGFLLTGTILWLVEGLRQPWTPKTIKRITIPDALLIGVMQGIAILPAVSRAGMTIAGALMRGIDRETAARFSFILSAPAILGAGFLELKDLPARASTTLPLGPILVGSVAAAVSGYLAIRFMLRLLATSSMRGFSIYVWILGVVVLVDQYFVHRYF